MSIESVSKKSILSPSKPGNFCSNKNFVGNISQDSSDIDSSEIENISSDSSYEIDYEPLNLD